MKKILQPILLFIVALGIGTFVWGKIRSASGAAPETAQTVSIRDKTE